MKSSDRFSSHEIRAVCCCCGRKLDVINVSLGGLFVASEIRPRVGESMTIELRIGTQAPFRIQGQVAWVNEGKTLPAPELPLGYGVRIHEIDMVAKLALLNYLRHVGDNQVR